MDLDLGPGYTLNIPEILALHRLEWIYAAAHHWTTTKIELQPLFDDQPSDGRRSALETELRDRTRQGLLKLDIVAQIHDSSGVRTLGYEGWSCWLTEAGVRFVEEVQRRRGDLIERRRAARDARLRWLYQIEAAADAGVPGYEDLIPYGCFYGDPFSAGEISAAERWLLDHGYISGLSQPSNGRVDYPALTLNGMDAVESGRSVNSADAASPAVDAPAAVAITISGNNNVVQAASPGAAQHVEMSTEERQQILSLTRSIEDALPVLGLRPDGSETIKGTIVAVREETAKQTPERRRVKAALGRLAEALAASAATDLGHLLIEQVHRIVGGL